MRGICQEYAYLLAQFVDRSLSASQFCTTFQSKFQKERRELDDDVFAILDRVFADAELFSEDAELLARRPDMYIDEGELRRCIGIAIQKLQLATNRKNN